MKGRGEPIRLALYIGGIPFEDERVKGSDFKALKESGRLPLGQVPIMEVDGTVLCQSKSLLRLAGKLSNLYPTDVVKAAIADQFIDTVEEFGDHLAPTYGIQDAEKRIQTRKHLADNVFPAIYEKLEKLSKKHGDWVAGDEMTIADIHLFQAVQYFKMGILDGIPADSYDKYPNLLSIYERVKQHPKVVEWYAKH